MTYTAYFYNGKEVERPTSIRIGKKLIANPSEEAIALAGYTKSEVEIKQPAASQHSTLISYQEMVEKVKQLEQKNQELEQKVSELEQKVPEQKDTTPAEDEDTEDA